MPNRVESKFQSLKRKRKKAFIAFITAGDPSLSVTEQLVLNFEKAGVDIVELGVPFSDPLADGPTIQAASERALKKGITLAKILQTVKKIRQKSQIPITLMTYYNPIFHMGEERFMLGARQAGVDGVIVPDLPLEEAQPLIKAAKRHRIATIFFISPTTTMDRIKTIIRASSGFIYYVSLTGVTGTREVLPSDLISKIRLAKRFSSKPVCVGFGVSTPAHVKLISRNADGVIVGSAIVKEIQKNSHQRDLVKRVSNFISRLTAPLESL